MRPRGPILEVKRLGTTDVAVHVRFEEQEQEGDTEAGADAVLSIDGYDINYRIWGERAWTRAAEAEVKDTDPGFILSGLRPNATYELRAASVAGATRGDFSRALQFSTLEVRNQKQCPLGLENESMHVFTFVGFLLCEMFVWGNYYLINLLSVVPSSLQV